MPKSMERRFIEEVYNHLDFWPAWTPLQMIELGSVGQLVDFKFERHTTLEQLGIHYEVASGPMGDMQYATSGGYQMGLRTNGDLGGTLEDLADGYLGLTIEFKKNWCIVLVIGQAAQLEIANLGDVARQIGSLRDWDPRFAIVTSLIPARQVTVLIAESRGSSIELAADSRVAATLASLVNVGAGVRLVASRSMSYCIVGEGPATPLFRVHFQESTRGRWRDTPSVEVPSAGLLCLSPAQVSSWYGES